MMNNIVFHIDAISEYMDASIWYEQQKAGLGLRFEMGIEQKLQQIAANPLSYSFRKKPFREAVTDIFPYFIVYKYYELKHEIYISAIYHTSRNPKGKYRVQK